MYFNIIVRKSDNQIIMVSKGFSIDEDFLTDFYNPKMINENNEEVTRENTTTDYYSMIGTDFDLLESFVNGKQYRYLDNEIMEVKYD